MLQILHIKKYVIVCFLVFYCNTLVSNNFDLDATLTLIKQKLQYFDHQVSLEAKAILNTCNTNYTTKIAAYNELIALFATHYHRQQKILLDCQITIKQQDILFQTIINRLNTIENQPHQQSPSLSTALALTRAVNPTKTGNAAISTNKATTLKASTPGLAVKTDSSALKTKTLGTASLAGSLS